MFAMDSFQLENAASLCAG